MKNILWAAMAMTALLGGCEDTDTGHDSDVVAARTVTITPVLNVGGNIDTCTVEINGSEVADGGAISVPADSDLSVEIVGGYHVFEGMSQLLMSDVVRSGDTDGELMLDTFPGWPESMFRCDVEANSNDSWQRVGDFSTAGTARSFWDGSESCYDFGGQNGMFCLNPETDEVTWYPENENSPEVYSIGAADFDVGGLQFEYTNQRSQLARLTCTVTYP